MAEKDTLIFLKVCEGCDPRGLLMENHGSERDKAPLRLLYVKATLGAVLFLSLKCGGDVCE